MLERETIYLGVIYDVIQRKNVKPKFQRGTPSVSLKPFVAGSTQGARLEFCGIILRYTRSDQDDYSVARKW